MNTLQTMKDILKAESEAIAAIPITENYDHAVELIVTHTHHLGGKLVTAGVGKAGHIANNIATTFSSTGTPAVSISPCDAQHGDIGLLQPNDVLILISNSGRTDEILKLLSGVRNLYPQMPIIAIVGDANSPLAELADTTLVTAKAKEVGPYGLTPTTSITMMTVIGHLLVNGVVAQTDFTREQYAMLHQGGCLGRKLRSSLN